MRVLFVVDKAWPGVGGVETLVRHVAGALAEDHQVSVLALRIDDGPSTRLSNGLTLPPPFEPFADGKVGYKPLVLSRRRRAKLLPLALQIVPVARRYAYSRVRRAFAATYASVVGPAIAEHADGADVIHTWTTDLVAAAGVRAARLMGARSVITPFLHVGQWGADHTSVRTYKKADRVVGLLETEKQSLVDLGVPAERVGVCGACTPGLTRDGMQSIREKYGISGPIVLFVGVRRSYKGVDLLLEASPRVAEKMPDVTFAFVGPGDAIGAPGGVNTVDAGRVESGELAAWMEEADLLCLPSAHEIFPTSILEAWSYRTPVLASNIPPLCELMTRSGGGQVTERDPAAVANGIVKFLSDPGELRKCGERGEAFWRANHTPEAVAKCYAQQYTQLLSEKPRT